MDKPKKVVVDIDGVLADEAHKGDVYGDVAGWRYERCIPLRYGIELVRRLKAAGCFVTLYTARWEKQRAMTEEWLKRYEVPYDVLQMDKPSGAIYIDDRGYRWREEEGGEQLLDVLSHLGIDA
jgi:uncharacterized HAD superfamily protein